MPSDSPGPSSSSLYSTCFVPETSGNLNPSIIMLFISGYKSMFVRNEAVYLLGCLFVFCPLLPLEGKQPDRVCHEIRVYEPHSTAVQVLLTPLKMGVSANLFLLN